MRKLAIIAIVLLFAANAAFADSEEYVVKAKLDKVVRSLDTIKTAISMYVMEQGTFPGKADVITQANSGKPLPASSAWSDMGFSVYPTLPPEVLSLSYVPFNVQAKGGARSFAIVLVLNNIKPGTIDGQLIGFSPSDDMVITGPASATSAVGDIRGLTALTFHYGCHQMNSQPVDSLVTNFFTFAGAPMVCK